MKPADIQVTYNHILRGVACTKSDGPISIAIKAQVPGVQAVSVTTTSVAIKTSEGWSYWETSTNLTDWIIAHDMSESVEPFTLRFGSDLVGMIRGETRRQSDIQQVLRASLDHITKNRIIN